MKRQIDEICAKIGVWPHADLSGHAHNYQRFTRARADGTQIPYVVCGNGGHNVTRLTHYGDPALRAPTVIQAASKDADEVTLENYDDQNYGYLRIVVDDTQLRIEYHPATDGPHTKTPDDSVTIDLESRQIVHYAARNAGVPAQAREIRKAAAEQKKQKKIKT